MAMKENIHHLIHDDLARVNHILVQNLNSDIPLAQELSEYVIQSGGKRLRPILVLIVAKLFNYQDNKHCQLAAIIELIHTATLLHDDVVDHSNMRRGQATANKVYGNSASILVGDFLYSRAFQMMVQLRQLPILEVLADATNLIAEGEVMQLCNSHVISLTEERYLETIRCKTGTLFEAAAKLGAILCQRSNEETLKLANYGRCLGMAFQLVDDALDYGSSNADIGKNLGDDFAEGKITLPVIYAMQVGTMEQRHIIEKAIQAKHIDVLPNIIEIFASTRALEYTYNYAEKYVKLALESIQSFPKTEARMAMEELAKYAIERSY